MILIATDEAGYGPKLGPLVVTASAWQIPEEAEPASSEIKSAFAAIAQPFLLGGQTIVVADSKAVFQPHASGKASSSGPDALPAYSRLQWVTLAGCRWCGLAEERLRIVQDLATLDAPAIAQTPWLDDFSGAAIETDAAQPLVDHWCTGGARLLRIQARVITADSFNRCCDAGMNKSDLLSKSTLDLVRSVLDGLKLGPDEAIAVFCDRHGGRRYYAGPLQSTFGGTLIQVISESRTESSYRVPYGNGRFRIRFTVKGDSFTPVAFSSMVAKYLREKAMESMNHYFQMRHQGSEPLRRTAGYPVDADRFLQDAAATIRSQGIDLRRLVRAR
jgi:hypothetical protein